MRLEGAAWPPPCSPTSACGPPSATAPASASASARRFGRRDRHDAVVFLALALALALPNLVLDAVFVYRPVLQNLSYSTLDWTLGSTAATQVGLGNCTRFLTDPASLQVLGTTAVFTVVTVAGSMLLGLGGDELMPQYCAKLLSQGVADAMQQLRPELEQISTSPVKGEV